MPTYDLINVGSLASLTDETIWTSLATQYELIVNTYPKTATVFVTAEFCEEYGGLDVLQRVLSHGGEGWLCDLVRRKRNILRSRSSEVESSRVVIVDDVEDNLLL